MKIGELTNNFYKEFRKAELEDSPELRHIDQMGFGQKEDESENNVFYEAILLEVAIENEKALLLYKSCGFKEITVYDYYEIILYEYHFSNYTK